MSLEEDRIKSEEARRKPRPEPKRKLAQQPSARRVMPKRRAFVPRKKLAASKSSDGAKKKPA